MLFEGGFTFSNFLADVFAVFMFVLWFWLFIITVSDLFRRHDVSGFGKVCWVILLIILPYIGIFAYLLTQGRGMAERNEAGPGKHKRTCASSWFSAADEIETGSIKGGRIDLGEEYGRMRARLVQ